MGCEREGRGRAAARPLCSWRRLPVDEWHSKVAGRACLAPTDCCFRHRGFGGAWRRTTSAASLLRKHALAVDCPAGQSLCAPQFRCAQLWPHAHNPAPRRNSGSFLWFFLLLPKERTTSRGAAVNPSVVSPAADSPQSRRTSARSRTARWQRASRPGSANRPGR